MFLFSVCLLYQCLKIVLVMLADCGCVISVILIGITFSYIADSLPFGMLFNSVQKYLYLLQARLLYNPPRSITVPYVHLFSACNIVCNAEMAT